MAGEEEDWRIESSHGEGEPSCTESLLCVSRQRLFASGILCIHYCTIAEMSDWVDATSLVMGHGTGTNRD